MAEPLADFQDLADLWRPLTDEDQLQAIGLLDKASALLRQKQPRIDDRIANGTLDPVVVAAVVANVVARFLNNPKNLVSTATTTGPFSKSESYRGGSSRVGTVQPAGLIILSTDLDALKPYSPRAVIGSIRTRPTMAPRLFPYGLVPTESGALDAEILGRVNEIDFIDPFDETIGTGECP